MRKDFIEPDGRGDVGIVVQAPKVDVVDVEFGSSIKIHESEAGAGDFVDVEVERIENALGQQGLAGAEAAAKQENVAGLDPATDLFAEGEGILGGFAGVVAGHSMGRPICENHESLSQ